MPERIDYGLAVSLAGQVAVGLTPGDEKEGRASAALTAIGLMLLTATQGDERAYADVSDVLGTAERARVTVGDDGTITVSGEPAA